MSLLRYILIDTPGQIEVFTWSASGTIITEALVGLGRPVTITHFVGRNIVPQNIADK